MIKLLHEARKAVLAMREMERSKSYPFWNARDEWIYIIAEPGRPSKILARGTGCTAVEAVLNALALKTASIDAARAAKRG